MSKRLSAAVLAALFCLSAPAARAEVKVPALFSDGMVLQQGVACPVWGTADPEETVSVILNVGGEKIDGSVKADKDGKWHTTLSKLKAGGPYTLAIGNQTINDVYVGEVWVASGQSNMEWSLKASFEPKMAIENSKNPRLRLFTVKKTAADTPQTDVPREGSNGKWLEAGPDTVPTFSAVAYYFGRDLQKALDVPVGIIHTSWGGTASEEWTSMKVLDANPEHKGKHPRQAKLYNGMIAPLIPYAIKGAIWYQGESNAGRAELYRTGFPLMIKNWRDDWKQGDFPFLFVQLAPFMKIESEPTDTGWARLREAQLMTLKVPHTGMAVITDVGDEKDIHPRKKEPVGARLALAARAIAYGEKIEYSGPLYESMKVEGNKAVLSFTHVGKGLEAKGETLTGFTVAAEDKQFHNAQAEIKGDKVVVWSDKVGRPVAVRFGWANYPVVNLWNKDGLAASPFRTDDWPPEPPRKPKERLPPQPAPVAPFNFTVAAGKHDRKNEPVVLPCQIPNALAGVKSAVIEDEKGQRVAAGQVTPPGLLFDHGILPPNVGHAHAEIHFILPELKAGATLNLRAVPVPDTAEPKSANAFSWHDTPGEFLELRFGDRPVLRYMYQALDDSTKEKRDQTFKVFHHLYDPAGKHLVTNGPGGLYPHHRGLFYGFRKVTYDGQEVDIWHCTGDTYQGHEKFLEATAGPVLGRQRVRIGWYGKGKEKFATEERELTVYAVPGGRLVEFASRVRPVKGPVKLDGDPQHAGFHFRADNEVAAKSKDETIFIRPDGEDKPGASRNWPDQKTHVNLPWDAMSFVLGGQRYTAAYLDKPSNPKEARYSERPYGRFGSYFVAEATEKDPVTVDYRIWLQEGKMTGDEVAAKSTAFVSPVEVKVR
jgi:sialate O-acetylesterase